MTSTEEIQLDVSTRNPGKGPSRKLRKELKVPLNIYGPKIKNTLAYAEEKFIKKYSLLKYENELITLKSDSKDLNGLQVLMKDVTKHPVSRRPLHVDFYAADLTKTVKVNVEIKFEGKAEGLSEGGSLQPLLRELEVECLPASIPDYISANVESLKLNDTLHIDDLTFPEGVKPVSSENLALATVTVIKEEPLEPTEATPIEDVPATAQKSEAADTEKAPEKKKD